MKLAVVGLGHWGPNLLRNLVNLVGGDRVVAVDQSASRLSAVRHQFHGVACRSSLDEVLADPAVGAVLLCTPTSTHGRLARRILESGRHVLVEKPLTNDVEQAAELVALAAERGLILMVGHTFLFNPRVERVAEYVRDRLLGSLYYVTSSRLNLGPVRQDVSVIWDLGPHDVSILSYVLGEFPVTVQTSGRSVLSSRHLDVAFIVLTFPSGIVASVNISWLSPRKVRSTVLVGDRQMLVYDDLEHEEPVRVYDKGVVMPPADFGEHQMTYRYGDVLAPHINPREPLAEELAHFLDCIAGEALGRSDGTFGLRVVEVLEAAERSWHNGGRVTPVRAAPLPSPNREADPGGEGRSGNVEGFGAAV